MDFDASRLAEVFRSAARVGVLEKHFREQVEEHLISFARASGIEILPQTERTLGVSGRADTIYNRLVVEWEKPGSLRDSNHYTANQKTIAQVQRYGDSLFWRHRERPGRIVGCCTDGHYFIFVTKPAHVWQPESPLSVNEESCRRFLEYFRSLNSGVALLPEYLSEDFSAENIRTQRAINALYQTLCKHAASPFLDAVFSQWMQFFGAVTEYKQWQEKLNNQAELRKMLKAFGLPSDRLDLNRFFFATHTFFAILTKLLAYLIVGRYTDFPTPPLSDWTNLPNERLAKHFEDIEQGGPFRKAGIRNFLEGDFFAWYTKFFTPELAACLKKVVDRLAEYDTTTLDLAPAPTQDLLKKLYHRLVPPHIRKTLGEYYTPDWLAEHLLNRLDNGRFRGDPDLRLLDPSCGSGTFLIKAINAVRSNAETQTVNKQELLRKICHNIVGIDLNPLAVIAARTNYLLALGSLLKHRGDEDLEIPVYLADSIMTPSRQSSNSFEQEKVPVSLSIGKVEIPRRLATQEGVTTLTNLLDEHLEKHSTTPEKFIIQTKSKLIACGANWEKDEETIAKLYAELYKLHCAGRNGLWARILKNAFAPVFLAPFDYVVGNPPWINWQNLPEGYRKETKSLWFEHGLFVHKGMDAILGKGKKDISTLMTYVAADAYLKDGGKLGFVITQGVFKTSGAGQGFRRLITRHKKSLTFTCVDDFSKLQPFEGANNRTALFVMQKDQPVKYPIPYYFWHKKEMGHKGSFDYEATLDEVKEKIEPHEFIAEPVNPKDKTSALLAGYPSALKAVKKLRGKSAYKAHTGVYTGGANAVYWFEILHDHGNGTVTARNITDGAKRKIDSVQVSLEKAILYPLTRARDIERWKAKSNGEILFVQDVQKRKGMEEMVLRQKFPLADRWLNLQRQTLIARAAYKKYFRADRDPFYSMFDTGTYTMARWKVVWRGQVAPELIASVISETRKKLVIPDQTAYYVSFSNPQSAHYLCAVLNSPPVRLFYALHGYKHVSQKFIEQINIPNYDPANKIHHYLSELSCEAHKASNQNDEKTLKQIEHRLNKVSAKLWGFSEKEIDEMRRNLEELTRNQNDNSLNDESEE